MKTILVSGASGIVGYGCLKSLRNVKDYHLIGTSIYDSMTTRKFCDIFLIAPHTGSADYIEWLKRIVVEYHVDLLIPGIEIDMYKWNQHKCELEELGTKLMLNNSELIKLCEDKWQFYQKLCSTDSSLCIPTYMEDDYRKIVSEVDSPFMIKPRKGCAAKGIVKIHDEVEFSIY